MTVSKRLGLVGAFAVAAAMLSTEASAQQKTFHLDRLETPGAPDDGVAVFRPQTLQRNSVYGQLALAYALNPLRTRNITDDRATINRSSVAVMKHQFSIYGSAGFELIDRVILGVNVPLALVQSGSNPNYGATGVTAAGTKLTAVTPDGAAMGDIRLDARFTLLRTLDRRSALGAQLSLFAPTGSTTNFGGDGQTTAMFMLTGETSVRTLILAANLGIHFRPDNSINDPANNAGLGIGNELRWALGAFLPLADGKFRVGANLFGQTGIDSSPIIGDTTFRKQNTSMEWNAEGRMRFGNADRWWGGIGMGSRTFNAYGSPDFRTVVMVGSYWPVFNSDASAPDRKATLRDQWKKEASQDQDHDGIPDEVDACPTEPEDHLPPDPNDGCPTNDRDGDGIPDSKDKCPDQPEDKDGIDDEDGCPEDDADQDGIGDAQDACPKEPGPKSNDPKHNGCPQFIKVEGNSIRILQQVHFAFGSATILPDSFPMLQEIVNVLKVNPQIKHLSVEGHTDNKGPAALNKTLSQNRANSVMKWLVDHGTEQSRLEAHGYGMERPIEDNKTDKGRAANRRVEFKILEEAGAQ